MAEAASVIPEDAVTEIITSEDIQVGDVIYVVLDEEGNAAEVTVLADADHIAALYSEVADDSAPSDAEIVTDTAAAADAGSEDAATENAEDASEAVSEENSTEA